MVAVQVSMCLPQVVRLKKVAEISTNLQNVMKTLSFKETEAVGNAFEINAFKTKEEKMIPWD